MFIFLVHRAAVAVTVGATIAPEAGASRRQLAVLAALFAGFAALHQVVDMVVDGVAAGGEKDCGQCPIQ